MRCLLGLDALALHDCAFQYIGDNRSARQGTVGKRMRSPRKWRWIWSSAGWPKLRQKARASIGYRLRALLKPSAPRTRGFGSPSTRRLVKALEIQTLL